MTPTQAELSAFISRIEAQNQRIKEETEARKEIYDEAKARGYSTPILREIIKLRKMSPDDRAEHETQLAVYMANLGMA